MSVISQRKFWTSILKLEITANNIFRLIPLNLRLSAVRISGKLFPSTRLTSSCSVANSGHTATLHVVPNRPFLCSSSSHTDSPRAPSRQLSPTPSSYQRRLLVKIYRPCSGDISSSQKRRELVTSYIYIYFRRRRRRLLLRNISLPRFKLNAIDGLSRPLLTRDPSLRV